MFAILCIQIIKSFNSFTFGKSGMNITIKQSLKYEIILSKI